MLFLIFTPFFSLWHDIKICHLFSLFYYHDYYYYFADYMRCSRLQPRMILAIIVWYLHYYCSPRPLRYHYARHYAVLPFLLPYHYAIITIFIIFITITLLLMPILLLSHYLLFHCTLLLRDISFFHYARLLLRLIYLMHAYTPWHATHHAIFYAMRCPLLPFIFILPLYAIIIIIIIIALLLTVKRRHYARAIDGIAFTMRRHYLPNITTHCFIRLRHDYY